MLYWHSGGKQNHSLLTVFYAMNIHLLTWIYQEPRTWLRQDLYPGAVANESRRSASKGVIPCARAESGKSFMAMPSPSTFPDDAGSRSFLGSLSCPLHAWMKNIVGLSRRVGHLTAENWDINCATLTNPPPVPSISSLWPCDMIMNTNFVNCLRSLAANSLASLRISQL